MKHLKAFCSIMGLLVVLLVSLTGCKKWNDDDDNRPYKGMSASQLRKDSEKELKSKQYASAIKRLEALESMYPFSDYAEGAQKDLIYAYYQNEDYPSAAATAERFTRLYPRSKNIDYAYYMKAMANFQQTRGALSRYFPLDESWRDLGTQAQSFADFTVLVQRFPDSVYKREAMQRMIYLRNLFANRELNAANYYFDRKMYVAARERAGYVVKNYPQSSAAQPALALVYRSSKLMGLEQAAAEALAVYQATYQASPLSPTPSIKTSKVGFLAKAKRKLIGG